MQPFDVKINELDLLYSQVFKTFFIKFKHCFFKFKEFSRRKPFSRSFQGPGSFSRSIPGLCEPCNCWIHTFSQSITVKVAPPKQDGVTNRGKVYYQAIRKNVLNLLFLFRSISISEKLQKSHNCAVNVIHQNIASFYLSEKRKLTKLFAAMFTPVLISQINKDK